MQVRTEAFKVSTEIKVRATYTHYYTHYYTHTHVTTHIATRSGSCGMAQAPPRCTGRYRVARGRSAAPPRAPPPLRLPPPAGGTFDGTPITDSELTVPR